MVKNKCPTFFMCCTPPKTCPDRRTYVGQLNWELLQQQFFNPFANFLNDEKRAGFKKLLAFSEPGEGDDDDDDWTGIN